jgi:hypothetical protein
MKKTFVTLFVALINFSLYSQDFNTMEGDWMRVKVEYKDGEKVPNNNGSRALIRYHFTKKEIYQVIQGSTIPSEYTRTGNVLKIAPIQVFAIEAYTKKALTLVDADGAQPMRYYMIPTDSFQVSGRIKYLNEVVGTDTIYASAPGIEPLYAKGQNEFMKSLMMGFSQTVGFQFSYVVQKDGTIGDVTIKVSTNPKLEKRLIQLVKKTSGKWIPATYKGKPVNVRQSENLSLNNK